MVRNLLGVNFLSHNGLTLLQHHIVIAYHRVLLISLRLHQPVYIQLFIDQGLELLLSRLQLRGPLLLLLLQIILDLFDLKLCLLELQDLPLLIQLIPSQLDPSKLHLLLFALNLDILHIVLELPIDCQLGIQVSQIPVHDLVHREITADQVHIVLYVARSLLLQPIAKERGAFTADLILSEAELGNGVIFLLDCLEDREEALIRHLVCIELDDRELRFLILSEDRANFGDSRIKDVVIRVFYFS